MKINFNSIKTLSDATNAINDLLAFREDLITNIIDQTIISKATGKTGQIRDITKKHLYMNFECSGCVPISLEKYLEVIDLDEQIIKNMNDYLDTYKVERKLNLLQDKLKKASKKVGC